jgi:hypothetical protein
MSSSLSREQVFNLINGERAYQDAQAKKWNHAGTPSIESAILMMEHYILECRRAWVSSSDPTLALDNIRKITGVAVRALENHGANTPQRNNIE